MFMVNSGSRQNRTIDQGENVAPLSAKREKEKLLRKLLFRVDACFSSSLFAFGLRIG
jgi:hypothetical protein